MIFNISFHIVASILKIKTLSFSKDLEITVNLTRTKIIGNLIPDAQKTRNTVIGVPLKFLSSSSR